MSLLRHTVIAALATAPALMAQDATTERVAVRVTAIAGSSVFLDKGRADGLTTGTEVRLRPPSGPSLVAIVRSVSTDSARADLPSDATPPPVGTTGEAVVETPDPRDPVAPRRTAERYDDLPWTNTDDGFDPSGPLLAPNAGTRPEEREPTWRGRVSASLFASRDSSGPGSNDYFLARANLRTTGTNLFGHAGDLELAFDVDRRGADLFDTGDESDSRARLERVSYTRGLAPDDPYRVQFGRFFSRSAPELGLLDGAEMMVRTTSAVNFGAFAGALPRPFPARATGEDTAIHVFAEFVAEDVHAPSGVVGYQKTWHRGAADRDMLFGRLFFRPTEQVSLHSHAKIDFYTSGDVIKGSGPRVTESFTTVNVSPSRRFGGSVSHSYFEWLESDRREYQDIPITLVADGYVHRVRGSAWARASDRVRFRANIANWHDQDRTGTSWEVGTEFDPSWGYVSAAIFGVDGSFQSGPGLRLEARRAWDSASVRVGYTVRWLESRGLTAGNDETTSQSIRLGVDWHTGRWNYSIHGDAWFGDDEDAVGVSVFTHYRF